MSKKKVLFVCIHNSARSQMAEALLKQMAGDRFIAESAGVAPGQLNPIVVEVMNEIGIDIANNKTKSVKDFIKEGRRYDYVITVCDEASAERCPTVPGPAKRVHMGFADPSSFQGNHQEKLARTREVRDQINLKIREWVKGVV